MGFNIDAVLAEMLGAVKDSVEGDWDDLQGYAKQIFENEKAMLAELAGQRLRGEINDDELQSELDDEKMTIEAELKALNVISQAMTQRAANAAMDVLYQAIKLAL